MASLTPVASRKVTPAAQRARVPPLVALASDTLARRFRAESDDLSALVQRQLDETVLVLRERAEAQIKLIMEETEERVRSAQAAASAELSTRQEELAAEQENALPEHVREQVRARLEGWEMCHRWRSPDECYSSVSGRGLVRECQGWFRPEDDRSECHQDGCTEYLRTCPSCLEPTSCRLCDGSFQRCFTCHDGHKEECARAHHSYCGLTIDEDGEYCSVDGHCLQPVPAERACRCDHTGCDMTRMCRECAWECPGVHALTMHEMEDCGRRFCQLHAPPVPEETAFRDLNDLRGGITCGECSGPEDRVAAQLEKERNEYYALRDAAAALGPRWSQMQQELLNDDSDYHDEETFPASIAED